MRYLSIPAAVLFAGTPPSFAAGECPPEKLATFDFGTTSSGVPYVPISIAGQTINLKVSTGGIESGLTSAVVRSLDLPRGTISNYKLAMGSDAIDHYATAHDVDFGGHQMSTMSFLVLPDGHLANGIGGILGPDLLRKHNVEMDFARGKMNLFSSKGCRGNITYWTQQPHFEVPLSLWRVGPMTAKIKVDGKEFTAVIDLGSAVSSMPLERAAQLFQIGAGSPGVRPAEDYGAGYYRFRFKSLMFENGPVLSDPDIILIEHSQQGFNEDMDIGLDVLRQFHLYIAYGSKTLYMTTASAR